MKVAISFFLSVSFKIFGKEGSKRIVMNANYYGFYLNNFLEADKQKRRL